MPITIAIFVFNDVEVLDFAGPSEVFTTAARVHAKSNPDHQNTQPVFRVFTVAQSCAPLHARAGLNVLPEFDFTNHPPIDVLVVPGGVVTEELKKHEVIAWLRKISAHCTLTASVCTGAFLLAKADLLEHKTVTTHWEDIDELRSLFPALKVVSGRRWVDEGNMITSAGISAGIDMSLHVVERLAGRALARLTARQMEFDWTENSGVQSNEEG